MSSLSTAFCQRTCTAAETLPPPAHRMASFCNPESPRPIGPSADAFSSASVSLRTDSEATLARCWHESGLGMRQALWMEADPGASESPAAKCHSGRIRLLLFKTESFFFGAGGRAPSLQPDFGLGVLRLMVATPAGVKRACPAPAGSLLES